METLLQEVIKRLDRIEKRLANEHPSGVDADGRYTVREVAKIAGISESAVYSHHYKDNLRATPTGTRKKVFIGSDVIAFLERRAGGAA